MVEEQWRWINGVVVEVDKIVVVDDRNNGRAVGCAGRTGGGRESRTAETNGGARLIREEGSSLREASERHQQSPAILRRWDERGGHCNCTEIDREPCRLLCEPRRVQMFDK